MPTTWPCDTSPALIFCQVCEQSPAVVTCKADAAALCSSCDHHIHSANPLAHRHQRVPFFNTPSDLTAVPERVPTDILHHSSSQPTTQSHHSWLIPNHHKKIDPADFLFSPDFDPFLDSGSTDFDLKQQVTDELCSVVPIQPRSTHLDDFSNERCFEIDFANSKLSPFKFSASVSSSDVGVVPDGNSNSNTNTISEVSNISFSNSTSTKGNSSLESSSMAQLSPDDRKARVLRYREKRKNRRFQKTIRYASRKAYAEIRPRIKGRFAKRTHIDADAEVDMIYGSAIVGNFIVDDDMYGVVPSL